MDNRFTYHRSSRRTERVWFKTILLGWIFLVLPAAAAEKPPACAYPACLQAAWNFYQCGEIEKAEILYQRARRLSPDSEEAMLGLSLTAIERKDYETAASLCEKVIAKNPENLWALKRLAYVRYLQGKLRKARQNYERVLAAAPGDPDARLGLAWALFGQHRRFEARMQLRDNDTAASDTLKKEIGSRPDFGASAYFTGMGYLGSSIYSHSLGFYLFGYLNYQDLLTLSVQYNRTYTWTRSPEPPPWMPQPANHRSYIVRNNINPQIQLHYRWLGLQLAYNRLLGKGAGSANTISGYFQLDFGWLGLNLGGAWSDPGDLQIWQASPELVFRPIKELSLSLIGGLQYLVQKNGPLDRSNHLSFEFQIDWRLAAAWDIKLSAWSGGRTFWIDRQTMIPLGTLDLYRLGFHAELIVTLARQLGLALGFYGQFGQDIMNVDIKTSYLGGYLGLRTTF